MKFGIDISTYQNGINLENAKKEGIEFVIIRGSFTGSANKSFAKDDRFEEHYRNAKKIGLGVGVYHYSRATNYEEGKKEAEFLYNNCLKGKKFEYPIYIDMEGDGDKNGDYNEAAKGFCDYIESKNGYAGIYCNLYWANNKIDYKNLSKDYDFWLAYWGKEQPKRSNYGNYGMWQFGGSTNLIRSNIIANMICDQDYAYKNYPEIMNNMNLNNFEEKIGNDTENKNDNTVNNGDDVDKKTNHNFFDILYKAIKKFANYLIKIFKKIKIKCI